MFKLCLMVACRLRWHGHCGAVERISGTTGPRCCPVIRRFMSATSAGKSDGESTPLALPYTDHNSWKCSRNAFGLATDSPLRRKVHAPHNGGEGGLHNERV
jgi:hypothetical protein